MRSIEQEVPFLTALGLHATIAPYGGVLYADQCGWFAADIKSVSEKLRGTNVYPRIFDTYVMPVAARAAAAAPGGV